MEGRVLDVKAAVGRLIRPARPMVVLGTGSVILSAATLGLERLAYVDLLVHNHERATLNVLQIGDRGWHVVLVASLVSATCGLCILLLAGLQGRQRTAIAVGAFLVAWLAVTTGSTALADRTSHEFRQRHPGLPECSASPREAADPACVESLRAQGWRS